MKSFVIFLILASFLSLSFAQNDDTESYEDKAGIFASLVLSGIMSLTERENRSILVKSEYNESLHCLANVRQNGSFCNMLINHFSRCTDGLVDTIESSVEHRKVGLATAMVTSLVSQLTFVCNTDGEHIFEIFNPCVIKTFRPREEGEEATCIRNFIDEMRSYRKTSNTFLSVMCKACTDAKNCIKGPFESNCPNAITRNTIEELYNRNMKVCEI